MSFRKYSPRDKVDLNLSRIPSERINSVETIDTMEDGPLPRSRNSDRLARAHASLNEIEVHMRDDLTHEELAEANKTLAAAQKEYANALPASRSKKKS